MHYTNHDRHNNHESRFGPRFDNNTWRYHLSNELQNKRDGFGKCTYDMYRHMSAVMSVSGNILGIGYNHYPINGNNYGGAGKYNSIHAEVHSTTNAINNIIRKEGPGRLSKSPLAVNLIVVRTNGANSRPCHNCIQHLANNPYLNVQKVYYSTLNDNGISSVAVETMSTLIANSDMHVSRGNIECDDAEDEPVKPEQQQKNVMA